MSLVTRLRTSALALLLLAAAAAPARAGLSPSERDLFERGRKAFQEKDFVGAARLWESLAKARPSGEIWYRIGVALHRGGKAKAARAALEKALAIEPAHPRARQALAKLGAPELAAPVAAPATGPPPGPAPATPAASQDLLAGIVPAPDPAAADQAWEDAHRLRRQGKPKEAEARFVDAFRRGYARSEVDFYLGRTLLEDEAVQPALLHLLRARDAAPGDQGIHLMVGKAYGLLGRVPDALEALGKALELDPAYGEAHFLAALAHDALGDVPKVLEHAQKAIRIDPAYREQLQKRLRDGEVVRKLSQVVLASVTGGTPGGAADTVTAAELDDSAVRLGRLLYPAELFPADLRGEAPPGSTPPDGLNDSSSESEQEKPTPRAPDQVPLAELRAILADLHAGKGRRAFERVPAARRADFVRRFVAQVRGDPALAALRGRVEAALRE